MKDSEFIELLNLYIDHEITAADAARLEAEVARNHGRARIYREYCRMQKACMVLAEQFRETAPVPGADRRASPESRARGWGLSVAAAGLAAACVALLVVGRHPAAGVNAAPRASLATADVPAVRTVAPAVASTPLESGVQPLFSLHLDPAASRGSALLVSSEQQDPFAWMNQVQLAPIQRAPVGPLMFDTKAAAPGSTPGTLNGIQKNPQGPVEMTAFQLQLDK